MNLFYKSSSLIGELDDDIGIDISIYKAVEGLEWFLFNTTKGNHHPSSEELISHIHEVCGCDISKMTQEAFEEFFDSKDYCYAFDIKVSSIVEDEDEGSIFDMMMLVKYRFEEYVFYEAEPDREYSLIDALLFPERFSAEVNEIIQHLIEMYREKNRRRPV